MAEVEKTDNGASMGAIYYALCGVQLPGVARWQEECYDALMRNPLAAAINAHLASPQPLDALSTQLSTEFARTVSAEEITAYLVLGAAACRDNRAVFRPVVHLFVRGIPGAVVTFPGSGNTPRLWLSGEDESLGSAAGSNFYALRVFTCSTCGQHYFIHYLNDFEFGKNDKRPRGGQIAGGGTSSQIVWNALSHENGGKRVVLLDKPNCESDADDDTPFEQRITSRITEVYMCRKCGAVHSWNSSRCHGNCGSAMPLVRLYAVCDNEKHPGNLSSCISCQTIGRYVNGRFREPIREVRAVTVADVHVLAQDIIQHADRKRLLLFTDNRQDAAFQAGWMRDHARRFRLRGLIARILNEHGTAISFGDMVCALAEIFDNDEQLSRALLPEVWQKADTSDARETHEAQRKIYLTIQLLRELTGNAKQRFGLEAWGRMKICYRGIEANSRGIIKIAQMMRRPTDEVLNMIEYILDIFRRRRMIWEKNYLLCTKIFESGHQYIQAGYMSKPPMPHALKFERTETDDEKNSCISFFYSGKSQNHIMQIVSRFLEHPEMLKDVMTAIWQLLLDTGLLCPVTLTGAHGTPLKGCVDTYQIALTKIDMLPADGMYWKCNHCSQFTQHKALNDECMGWRCKGKLQWYDSDKNKNNYDLQLLNGQYTMLHPAEHTAMVPPQIRDSIEKQFKCIDKPNSVNVLVCTPTLELGVDIGSLDCTLMRNVPPLPANYWQRVGRAGRRNRMAVNITYCRPTSYDKSYYDEPLNMLVGKVEPPAFNLQNPLLLEKHIHAAMLTWLHQQARHQSGRKFIVHEEDDGIRKVLNEMFPSLICKYLFDDSKKERTAVFDVTPLRELIRRYRTELFAYIRGIFERYWPEADRDVVSDANIQRVIDETADKLHVIITRIQRRQKWVSEEIKRLNAKAAQHGGINDKKEEEAYLNRLKRQIFKYQGEICASRRTDVLEEINTYNVLAVEGFLPGYGMDTGNIIATGEMSGYSGGGPIDLPRPTAMALREYVPGNLIYANSQKFVPRHFMLGVGEETRRDEHSFLIDRERGSMREARPNEARGSEEQTLLKTIAVCDVELAPAAQISDEEENRWQMPVLIYAVELQRHGGGVCYQWGDGGTMLQFRHNVCFRMVNAGTKNRGMHANPELGYYVCPVCGYSISPVSSDEQVKKFRESHAERCNGGRIPQRIGFYADVIADTLMLPDCPDLTIAYSVMESLRMAASHILDMQLADLQVLVIPHYENELVDAYLYDPMPGGSGLLQQIIDKFSSIHAEALRLLNSCSSNCESSCINCLQNYRNSFYHKYLNRHDASAFFTQCGETINAAYAIPAKGEENAQKNGSGEPTNHAETRLKKMLQKAGFMDGEWQKNIKFNHPLKCRFGSTTPDVFYSDPELGNGLCIYLDGMSRNIHGNSEARERDNAIRNELRNNGYEVLEITAVELDDRNAMIMHFKRIGRFLKGRECVKQIGLDTSWFDKDQ